MNSHLSDTHIQEDSAEKIEASDLNSRRLPFTFAKKYGVVMLEDSEEQPKLYFYDIPDVRIFSEIYRFAERPITYQLVEKEYFSEMLAKCYHNDSSQELQDAAGLSDDMDLGSLAEAVPVVEDLLAQSDDAPIIRLINAILTEAVKENASDVHIETFENSLTVRLRVDGILREILQLQRTLAALLVSRIKVMAKLDIAEKRIPQDGRTSLMVAGKAVDVRVSTLPSSNGERVVMRLLDKTSARLELKHLGMSNVHLNAISDLLKRTYGVLLVTGPTGSGKTTSLYSCLASLNDETRNILTIEDPIEYNLEGVGQTQVNAKAGMSFARGLRAILRQDPDVVMVGEIRDTETAEIAVQASLTGHLVLSTLHTNTAIGAITRLGDMGIEPFLLASGVIGIVAQRLIRVLCSTCKTGEIADESESKVLGQTGKSITIYRAVGCRDCNYTGYRGRSGIYEVIAIDDQLRRMIHSGATEQEMERLARETSMGIDHDGYQKVIDGVTTLEEVLRVIQKG